MKDSAIRTLAVLVYALLIKAGVAKLGLDQDWVNQAATIIATLVVYLLIRYGEQLNKYVGLLLLSTKQPVYVKGEVVQPAKEAVAQLEAGQTPAAADVAATDPKQPVVEVDPPVQEPENPPSK